MTGSRQAPAGFPPPYPRTPCWPWSPSKPPGDRTTSTPEDYLGRPLVITEKLDGAGAALFQGQAFTRAGNIQAPWLGMARRHHAWKIHGDLVVYGEDLYAVHSIEYEPMRPEETFHAFALRRGDRFAPWDEMAAACGRFGIPLVPTLWQGQASTLAELRQIVKDLHLERSALGLVMEGVVIRTFSGFAAATFRRHVCKSVRAGHVQTDEHWRRHWRPAAMVPDN